jgi:hypothetical protein
MSAFRDHVGIGYNADKWPTNDYANGATSVPDKQLMVAGLTHLTGSVEIIGPITTNITASGNISSSGIITGEGLVISDDASITDDLNIGGDITAVTNINLSNDLSFANNSKIQSTNEATTHITLYNDDYWKFTANNAYVAAFASSGATFNEDGVANCNFRVESDNDQYALYIDGGDNTIELGRQATTHVTASGNISASGNLSSSGLYVEGEGNFIGSATENEGGIGTQLAVGGLSGASIKIYSQHGGDNRDVGLHMSASSTGQEYSIGLARARNTFFISPSDVLTGPESSVFEIDAVGNITASGDISASGTVTANAFIGNITGDLTGEADTVATIAGLAPNTATTQATQGAITSVGTLTGLNVDGHISSSGIISASGFVGTPIFLARASQVIGTTVANNYYYGNDTQGFFHHSHNAKEAVDSFANATSSNDTGHTLGQGAHHNAILLPCDVRNIELRASCRTNHDADGAAEGDFAFWVMKSTRASQGSSNPALTFLASASAEQTPADNQHNRFHTADITGNHSFITNMTASVDEQLWVFFQPYYGASGNTKYYWTLSARTNE